MVIVIDPALGPIDSNLKAIDLIQDGPCPHLRGDKPGEHSCAVHDEPWYKETPCFSHGQIERSLNDECRMGAYILSRESEEEDDN